MKDQDIIKTFKLQSSISCNNFVLFSSERKVKRYKNPSEIMTEHFELRREVYEKRKEYMMAQLTKRSRLLENKVRFI